MFGAFGRRCVHGCAASARRLAADCHGSPLRLAGITVGVPTTFAVLSCSAGAAHAEEGGTGAAAGFVAKHQMLDGDALWNRTIAAATPAVVSIKVNRVRAFDTSSAGSVQATGFVVDAERGYIMTNRHVAGPGPIVAEAIFQNNEEVPLTVAYYDPVHDFAFFKFDPKALRHMALRELQLAPEEAERTSEIVIIGNNAGEKCSISRTTLARLDRNAPSYSRNGYNDFNTFYFHSASGTTGGSSGSPVLNQAGSVVALNAGGKMGTSAAFFLPLERAARALRLLQNGEPVRRGTLQLVCTHQTFDEATRLGLTAEREAQMRTAFPSQRGVLVVSEVVPEGPAALAGLQPGDVITDVKGELATHFVQLEDALDESVGSAIRIGISRGGRDLELSPVVDDLHELTPSRYFEVGGAVLNELSYQQARNHGVAVRGVYVAHPGHMLRQARVNKGSVIEALNGEPTPTLRHFIDAVNATPHGTPLTVRYHDISARSHVHLAPLRMDRKWFPISESARVDGGDWEPIATSAAAPPPPPPPPPAQGLEARQSHARLHALMAEQRTHFEAVMGGADQEAACAPEGGVLSAEEQKRAKSRALEKRVASALVSVDFTRPFCVDGETGVRYRGAGLVVDAARGVVAVDRGTVTSTLGDATVTLGGKVPIPACVRYVHPLHNFAIIQYDPALVPAEVKVGELPLVPKPLPTGAAVTLVGLKSGINEEFDTNRPVDVVARATRIANSGWMKLPLPNPPRFQVANTETLGLEVSPAVDGGVLADEAGVTALWVSCSYQPSHNQIAQVFRGLPVAPVKPVADSVARGETPPLWRSLGVALEPLSLAAARQLGVDEQMLSPPAGADARGVAPAGGATPRSVAAATTGGQPRDGVSSGGAAGGGDPPSEERSAGGGSNEEAAKRCVLLVSHARSDALAAGLRLRGGDLLLKLDGQPIRSLLHTEELLQGRDAVEIELLRDGRPLTLRCDTRGSHGLGTTHVVGWAGLLLQTAPEAVQAQRSVPAQGVYCSYRFNGSPASRYDLSPTSHIVEVDALPTPDLKSFLACVSHRSHGDVVRLKHVDLEGRVRMTALKLDLKYWPTFTLERGEDGEWSRSAITPEAAPAPAEEAPAGGAGAAPPPMPTAE